MVTLQQDPVQQKIAEIQANYEIIQGILNQNNPRSHFSCSPSLVAYNNMPTLTSNDETFISRYRASGSSNWSSVGPLLLDEIIKEGN
jgi:hypothetical protein